MIPQDNTRPRRAVPVGTDAATSPSVEDRDVTLDEFDELIRNKYGIPKGLWRGIAAQESGGNWNAVSPTGVRGKYQVTRATAAQYGLDRDDPFDQTAAAARHLREQYDALKSITNDNERWLGAVGRYYAGSRAVSADGTLSSASPDGVSNPVAHVDRVAQKWAEYEETEGAQAQGLRQRTRPALAPAQRQAQGLGPVRPEVTAFDFRTAPNFGDAQRTGARIQQQVSQNQSDRSPELVEARRRAGQGFLRNRVEDVARTAIIAGDKAKSLGNKVATLASAAGSPYTPAMKPFERLSPASREDLAARSAGAETVEPWAAPLTEGLTQAAVTSPLLVGGAMMGGPLGAAAVAAGMEDTPREALKAGAMTYVGGKVGQAITKAATPILANVSRPAVRGAATTATEAASGGLTNVAQEAALAHAQGQRPDLRRMAISGATGAITSAALSGGNRRAVEAEAARLAPIRALTPEQIAAATPNRLPDRPVAPLSAASKPPSAPPSAAPQPPSARPAAAPKTPSGKGAAYDEVLALLQKDAPPPEAQPSAIPPKAGKRAKEPTFEPIPDLPLSDRPTFAEPGRIEPPDDRVVRPGDVESEAVLRGREYRPLDLADNPIDTADPAREAIAEITERRRLAVEQGNWRAAREESGNELKALANLLRQTRDTAKRRVIESGMTRLREDRKAYGQPSPRGRATDGQKVATTADAETAPVEKIAQQPVSLLDSVVNPSGRVPEVQQGRAVSEPVDFGKLAEQSAKRKPSAEKRQAGEPLENFVVRNGGLNVGSNNRGDLVYSQGREGGRPGVLNQRGVSVDDMRAMANEAGFGPYETEADFLAAMRDARNIHSNARRLTDELIAQEAAYREQAGYDDAPTAGLPPVSGSLRRPSAALPRNSEQLPSQPLAEAPRSGRFTTGELERLQAQADEMPKVEGEDTGQLNRRAPYMLDQRIAREAAVAEQGLTGKAAADALKGRHGHIAKRLAQKPANVSPDAAKQAGAFVAHPGVKEKFGGEKGDTNTVLDNVTKSIAEMMGLTPEQFSKTDVDGATWLAWGRKVGLEPTAMQRLQAAVADGETDAKLRGMGYTARQVTQMSPRQRAEALAPKEQSVTDSGKLRTISNTPDARRAVSEQVSDANATLEQPANRAAVVTGQRGASPSVARTGGDAQGQVSGRAGERAADTGLGVRPRAARTAQPRGSEPTGEQSADVSPNVRPSYNETEKYHQPIPEVRYIRVEPLRRMNSGEVDRVGADTARNMNFDEPVKVSVFADGELRISDGHHRVAAAKQTGREFVPVELQAINAKGSRIQELIAESDRFGGVTQQPGDVQAQAVDPGFAARVARLGEGQTMYVAPKFAEQARQLGLEPTEKADTWRKPTVMPAVKDSLTTESPAEATDTTGRQLQHRRKGILDELTNQQGVDAGKVRVRDAGGNVSIVQRPSGRLGNQQASWLKPGTLTVSKGQGSSAQPQFKPGDRVTVFGRERIVTEHKPGDSQVWTRAANAPEGTGQMVSAARLEDVKPSAAAKPGPELRYSGPDLSRIGKAISKGINNLQRTRGKTLPHDFQPKEWIAGLRQRSHVQRLNDADLQRFNTATQIAEAAYAANDVSRFNRAYDLAEELAGKRGAMGLATEASAFTKSIILGFDPSYVLRQADKLVMAHPKRALQSLKTMARSYKSEANHDAAVAHLRANSDLSHASGLHFSSFHPQGARFEGFGSRVIESVPIIGAASKAAERANEIFLDTMRQHAFDTFADGVLANNTLSAREKLLELKSWAKHINEITGRAEIKATPETMEAAGLLMTAPQYTGSKFIFIGHAATVFKNLTPAARWAAVGQFFKWAGGTLLLGQALAVVTNGTFHHEPDKPDFGKVVTPQGIHYDVSGGDLPYLRMAVKSVNAVNSDSKRDAVREIGGIFGQFARQRLAPLPSAALSTKLGYDPVYQPTDAKREALGLITPAIAEDIYSAAKLAGTVGVVQALPAAAGVGVSAYKPSAGRQVPQRARRARRPAR